MPVDEFPAGLFDKIVSDGRKRDQQQEIDRTVSEAMGEIDVELAPCGPCHPRQADAVGKRFLKKDLHEINRIGDITQVLGDAVIAPSMQPPAVTGKIQDQRGKKEDHQRIVEGEMKGGYRKEHNQCRCGIFRKDIAESRPPVEAIDQHPDDESCYATQITIVKSRVEVMRDGHRGVHGVDTGKHIHDTAIRGHDKE